MTPKSNATLLTVALISIAAFATSEGTSLLGSARAAFCHKSAYNIAGLSCKEIDQIKADIREDCVGVLGALGDDIEEVWDTFSDCEHAHPLYVEHLEGHGADECKDDYEC
eukprot:jgi/Tetstr1/456968/TSEL_043637.t1